MFREVPVLPVVVPLAAVVLAVLLLHLRRRRLVSTARVAVALALCGYAAGIVANTVFPIFLDKPRAAMSWHDYVNVVPVAGYEPADALMNVVVFAPLGMVLPLLAPRAPWSRLLATLAGLSAAIEVTQYATAHLLGGGHVADVNDLAFNVLGGMIGLAVLRALSRTPAVALLDRIRWAPAVPTRAA